MSKSRVFLFPFLTDVKRDLWVISGLLHGRAKRVQCLELCRSMNLAGEQVIVLICVFSDCAEIF